MVTLAMVIFSIILFVVCSLTKRFENKTNLVLFAISLFLSIGYSLLYLFIQQEIVLILYGMVSQVMVYISFIDIKKREISQKLLLAIVLLSVVWSFIRTDIAIYNPYIMGIVVFALTSLLNKMFKNQIGGGDIKLLSVYGFVYGYSEFIPMCFFSLFLSMIVGLVLVIKNKKDLKYELPFAPFLLMGGVLYNILVAFGV